MPGGVHHEWGKLQEVVIGICPADQLVVFYEESQRWLMPEAAEFARRHAGRRLIDVDPQKAKRIEQQVEALAGLLGQHGVKVHRPERLQGEERTFMAPDGEGGQLFARDAMIMVGDRAIDASLRLRCRQRERFGLRPILQRMVAERRVSWSSVPLGSPAAVDGPFLEGGDVLLNGREIYVGMSGCASDMAGIDWLEGLLGTGYRVVPVALRSNVLHLDWALALIKPGLLICCPQRLIDGLPTSLRSWDKIEVSVEEARGLATDALILQEGHAIFEAGNQRVVGELKKRGLDAITLPFDGPISQGGGLRSVHHPLVRESALA